MNFPVPDSVIRDFFPNQSPLSIEWHGNGLIQHTAKLSMPYGKYLLQRINLQVFPEPGILAHNIRRIHQHLSSQATTFRILSPVYTHQQQAYAISADHQYWRLFDFIDEAHAIDKVMLPHQAHLAGQAYGTFIQLLSDFPPHHLQDAIPEFHNSILRWHHFNQILEADPLGRTRLALPEIDIIRRHHNLFYEINQLPLPRRIVHNDAKIGNILFCNNTGHVRAVTDWDTVMPGTLLADFGDLTRSIINPVAEDHPNPRDIILNIPLFEALCDGFLSALDATILPIEKTNLIKGAQWIVLEQAMRFLGDFIAGDTYYAVQHPDHNLDRARNQCCLFNELLEHEDELRLYTQC
jgi:hypothetical protein